ncbi:TetR/AcrR family transcriptional regulator [Pseudonocardia sp. GCM10023141]|uniref:TetR/AcrR family transcriptional regulator n=1 Tax=Pseudonocardia sp. GCM10023141 TaxID=3252653 RepID=UPI003617F640
MDHAPLRAYGGVSGDERQAERRAQLIEAGLELLGGRDGESTLSVRGACKQSGLTARYFYESFTDRDALAVAVLDHVVEDIAVSTVKALAAAAPDSRSQIRAGLANIVHAISADPRRGRLLFSAAPGIAVLAARRVEANRLFARMLARHSQEFYGIRNGPGLGLITEFLVGGMSQTLAAWQNGSLQMSAERLVERSTEMFLAVGNPSDAGAPAGRAGAIASAKT